MTRSHAAALVALGLAAISIVVFAPTSDFEFVNYDDQTYVASNPQVLGGLTWDNVRWAFGRSYYAANWHPLTWLSLQLDAQVGSLADGNPPVTKARVFHWTNVLLHAAAVVVCFLALLRMTSRLWLAAIAAGLFALHPLHVESVAWVSERKDVLSGLFWMLTLLAYASYSQRPSAGRYTVVALVLALGLLAKPMVVTLPFVLLLLDYWPLRRLRSEDSSQRWEEPPPRVSPRPTKQAAPTPPFSRVSWQWLLLEKVPLLALAAVTSIFTWEAQKQGEAMRSLGDVPLRLRLSNVLVTYVRYLLKSVWPIDLAVYYPLPKDGYATWEVVAAAAILLAVTWLALRQARRHPYFLVGWLWYLGTLVPVIGLVQVGNQALADRYTYLPLSGIFIALVWAGADLARRRQVQAAVLGGACGLLAALAAVSWLQIGYWHDSVTLWEHAATVTRDNGIAHSNLGQAYASRGRRGDPARAIEEFQRALRIKPDDATALRNLGIIRGKQGRNAEAEDLFRRALAAEPRDPVTPYHLGLILSQEGRLPEAVEQFRAAVERDRERVAVVGVRDPGVPIYRYYLGRALIRMGKWGEAVAALSEAVALQPDDYHPRVALAYALHKRNDLATARAEYEQAFRIAPGWADAINRDAWVYATNPDARQRNGPYALELAEETNQATGYGNPLYLRTLAAAYAERGEFKDAILAAEKALRLAGPDESIRRDLASYRQGRQIYQSLAPAR